MYGGLPMHHYTYKITDGTREYFGRHSTENLDDGYMGSGKWVRSIKDKTRLHKEILSFYETFDAVVIAEEILINENIHNENCMNFNNRSVGFATGVKNPAKSEGEKRRRSEMFTGDNNPAKRPEVREKISAAHKGRPSPHKGKTLSEAVRINMAAGRTGIKYSEEGKQKLSASRKRQYENGERMVPSFTGMKHTEDYKIRMSENAKNRNTITCEHCGGSYKPHTHKRWHGDNCKENNYWREKWIS